MMIFLANILQSPWTNFSVVHMWMIYGLEM